MNDQLLLDSYLLLLKSTVEVYVHGTLESSNKNIRKILKNNLDNIMSMQESTYDEMVKYNWYQVNNIDSKAVSKVLNKINNK